MNKLFLPLSFLITGLIIFYIARSQYRPPFGSGNPGCIENPNLYEDFLVPTKADTLEFIRQDSFKRYPRHLGGTRQFDYYSLPIVRGLIDTALFAPEHWNKFETLDENLRLEVASSPLVIEGDVVEVLNEDTAMKKAFLIPTVFIIRITDVIASKYKVKKGDYVTARTTLYGYVYSPITKEVSYPFAAIPQYQKGKHYLFVLDKYYYMSLLNNFRDEIRDKKIADVYCPYSFILSLETHRLSEAYANGAFTKRELKNFLTIQK